MSTQTTERRLDLMRRALGDDIVRAFDDPAVVEIMCNDTGEVFVEAHGRGMQRLGTLDVERALSFVGLVADHLSTVATSERPVVEGALPDAFHRARFAGAIPPIVPRPIFAIRLPARTIYTLDDYVTNGILLAEQKEQIVEAIEARRNIIVSGGTGSGKTTLTNAILKHIEQHAGVDERIVILEDTRELQCAAPNTASLLTDEDAHIDLTRLLKLTLRLRPDRIIVGEVRDGAALALLKAWNTGHPGGVSTLHANNPEAALLRLDQLCQEANVPSQRQLIDEAVDLVIQIARDPEHAGGRRITAIHRVGID